MYNKKNDYITTVISTQNSSKNVYQGAQLWLNFEHKKSIWM